MRISESEWKVMRVVWGAVAPVGAYDVIDILARTERWSSRTVRTLLARLVRKGVLGYRKYKNLYLYYPLSDEAECLRAESLSFLRRCFNGAVAPMVAHFIEEHHLTPAQIRELKCILEERASRKERKQ